MNDQDFELAGQLEPYSYFLEKTNEPMVAAILTLAKAVNDAGFAANLNDDTGHVNIRVTGDLETSEKP